jgi:hypothetical protein
MLFRWIGFLNIREEGSVKQLLLASDGNAL